MAQAILVVDDSPTIVKFVSMALKGAAYATVSAADGMDALEKLAHSEADVAMIITDLNMPNLDGYGLIQAVRGNPALRSLPIIILSSEEAPEDIARGIQSGANAYLVKPFNSQRLLETVKKFI